MNAVILIFSAGCRQEQYVGESCNEKCSNFHAKTCLATQWEIAADYLHLT
jgi:hypothetical protein